MKDEQQLGKKHADALLAIAAEIRAQEKYRTLDEQREIAAWEKYYDDLGPQLLSKAVLSRMRMAYFRGIMDQKKLAEEAEK